MKMTTEFPVLQTHPELVYLDNAATTLKAEPVMEAERAFLFQNGTNPHSTSHRWGYEGEEEMEKVREKVAQFINSSTPREIVFTSGTTAALNQVATGLVKQIASGEEIYTTFLEHGSNLLPWIKLSSQTKSIVKFLPLLANGMIDQTRLAECLSPTTKIVTFAHATNSFGTINDVAKISHIIRKIAPQALIVVDAAQTVGHLPINVQNWDVDFVAFSAHKMYGPFGVGVLWGAWKSLQLLEPLVYGGGMNLDVNPENCTYEAAPLPGRLEAGTSNVSGIIGLGAAIDFLNKIGFEWIQKHESGLKDYFRQQVNNASLTKTITFYNLQNDSPLIIFNSKKWPSQDVATFLDRQYQIAVRSGSHCTRLLDRHVGTKEMVRASFGIYNTKEDVDKLIEALKNLDQIFDIFFRED